MCRFRRQKLCPTKLLENPVFLFSHAGDALKLCSNRSEENLPHTAGASSAPTAGSGGLRGRLDEPPYTTLPFTQMEFIQRIIAVYLCLHGYLAMYTGLGEEKELFQNEVSPPALERIPAFASFGDIPPADKVLLSISDPIDTGKAGGRIQTAFYRSFFFYFSWSQHLRLRGGAPKWTNREPLHHN